MDVGHVLLHLQRTIAPFWHHTMPDEGASTPSVHGDQVLRNLADLIASTLQPTDVFGRLGGEEFAIILSENSGDQAFAAVERLRKAIADGTVVQITVSFGVSPLVPSVSSVSAWLERADRLLYSAKESGRNFTQLGAPI